MSTQWRLKFLFHVGYFVILSAVYHVVVQYGWHLEGWAKPLSSIWRLSNSLSKVNYLSDNFRRNLTLQLLLFPQTWLYTRLTYESMKPFKKQICKTSPPQVQHTVFVEFTRYQLSLIRPRKIVPGVNHVCIALQVESSPEILNKEVPLPVWHIPHDHQIATWV